MGAAMEQPILSRNQYNMPVCEAKSVWAVSSFKVCLCINWALTKQAGDPSLQMGLLESIPERVMQCHFETSSNGTFEHII